jgi:hypothetical protein
MRGGEISSTTLFDSSLSNPYVLCTTVPSLERVIHNGEWSSISPVGSAGVAAHASLVHDLTRLRKLGAILAGAVCPQIGVVALVEYREHQGRLIIMPLIAEGVGGLSTLDPIVLDGGALAIQDQERIKISPTAIRFYKAGPGYRLVAVDIKGKVVMKHFKE